MKSAKEIYKELANKRRPFLERARDNASLTIPSLFPPEGHTGSDVLPSPNQSFGSRAVNVLGSKMLLGLFPANVPFFRRTMPKRDQVELSQNNPELLAELRRVLTMIEVEAMAEAEGLGWRPVLNSYLLDMIVGGNHLLHVDPKDGELTGYNLRQYVTKLNQKGQLQVLVLEEEVDIDDLPEPTRTEVLKAVTVSDAYADPTKPVTLYTHVYRKGQLFHTRQEVMGVTVDGSEGSYPLDRNPWLPLKWKHIPGEHFGRSMVEDYFGDINALDVISKGVKEAVALGAKTVYLRNPSGLTRARDLAKSENGDIINGRMEDVGVLQTDKRVDLQMALGWVDRIETRLERAFLMHSSAQRSGERVTLGEIRFMINELNDALGGVYAVQAQELQHPLARLHLDRMTKKGLLPQLPSSAKIRLSIVTGLEALSREHELMSLEQGLSFIANLYGPEAIRTYTNPDNIITRVFTSLRLDPDGAIKAPEQVQAEMQQQQMQQLVQQLGPNAMQMLQQQAEAQQQGTPDG